MRNLRTYTIGSAIAIAVLISGCDSQAPTPAAPTSAPAAKATDAPAAKATDTPVSGAATAAPQSAGARGKGGTLKLLYWQAPAILNPHLSSGSKDQDASRASYEPLASYDKDGKLVPILAAEIPTVENSGVAKDNKSVTWKLKKDVKWSDGEPFTADDVKFTFTYLTNKETAATTASQFNEVASVDVVDSSTIKITFKDVNPSWAKAFIGINGQIIPQHIFKDYVGAKSREAPANLKPVGTGPYRVTDFKPGDTVIYEPNPYYRDPDKPFFARVELKGGGDATSAARAVLQTGDYDFAWNLQVEASVLKQLATAGKGRLVTSPGANVEQIFVNLTDPNKEVDGEKASVKNPHPFFSDVNVRNAFALAIDRKTIADQLYGPAGDVATNIIVAPPPFVSKNTSYEFNLDKAKSLLDSAGWEPGADGVRAKDGVPLSILFQTSVNPVRQKTQEIIKQALESIGFKVQLKSVDSTVFFSSSPTNLDDFNHFYADVEMLTTGSSSPDPGAYLGNFITAQITAKANKWSGTNYAHWSNPGYDKLYEQSKTELDPGKRQQLLIQLNDLVVNNYVVIPLIQRTFPNGVINTLDGIDLTPWDGTLWQIQNWTRKS